MNVTTSDFVSVLCNQILDSMALLGGSSVQYCFGVMCIHIMACITDRDFTYH